MGWPIRGKVTFPRTAGPQDSPPGQVLSLAGGRGKPLRARVTGDEWALHCCFFFFSFRFFFSFNITRYFLSWAGVSEGSEREFGSFTTRMSWETFASGPGGPSGKHRTRERLPRRSMKTGEEAARAHVGFPRQGQRSPAKQGEGLRVQEGRAEISSDDFVLVWLRAGDIGPLSWALVLEEHWPERDWEQWGKGSGPRYIWFYRVLNSPNLIVSQNGKNLRTVDQ